VEDFRMQRVDRDTLAITHDLLWAGTVGERERLVIDCTSEKVVYENSSQGNISGFPQLTRTRATMMLLEPGVNRLDISGDFTGDITLTLEYLEQWR
ncbi:MAG: phage tail family protein, partial [Anaerolineae bacterium]|nr:phage tail family protein [Anaerolineae bacterium]